MSELEIDNADIGALKPLMPEGVDHMSELEIDNADIGRVETFDAGRR